MIATSTKVEISGVNLEKFDDKYFAKEAEKKKKKGEGEFFEAEKEVCLSAFCLFYLILLFVYVLFMRICIYKYIQLIAVVYMLMV